MYELDMEDSLKEKLEKLARRDIVLYQRIKSKINEILENPHHYKPLRAPLQNKRRVHFGPFVLTFEIFEEKNTVKLLYLEHHDDAYQ